MSFVDRYGDSLEYDLHHLLGLDLLDFFRGKYSWRKLHSIIWKLPSTALSQEAMALDDELAQEALKAVETHKDTGPRLAEYSAEAQRLDVISDLLQVLISNVVSAFGGNPARIRPAKRPETALSRAREALSLARYNSLLDEVEEAQARWAAKHN